MIVSGEEEQRHGLKEVDTKACMCQEKSKVMENIGGLTNHHTQVNGQTIRLMGQGIIVGQMGVDTGAIGVKMICMEQEFTYTLMELDMKGSFKMIKKLAMVTIIGRMAENMKVIGTKASSMDQVFLEMPENKKLSMVFGSTEIVLSGSMKSKFFK